MNVATARRRPQGYIFYTTALIITLFACYSFLQTQSSDRNDGARLQARTFKVKNQEVRHEKGQLEDGILTSRPCRLVHDATDMCAFVLTNCPDEEAGLISYLQLYYCRLANAKPVALVLLIGWASLLFSTIGIAASDFLCINLSTIAGLLGMSESLTGVTFLAFGNGSPDVFSTFAAMSSHSGSLAIGELMGAAGFITAVVAGSMAIVKPFKVARKSFMRDILFFAVAAAFSLSFLADGNLRLWECAAMVCYYAFYVCFVVFWHWWQGRERRKRIQEFVARSQQHIPNSQELEIPRIEEDDEAGPPGERTALLGGFSSNSGPQLNTPMTPAWNVEDVDGEEEIRDRFMAEMNSNMRVSRPTYRERRNTITPIRPSLIGALEFRSVLHSLEKKSTNPRPINLRRYSEEGGQEYLPAQTKSYPGLLLADVPEEDTRSRASSNGRIRAVSVNDAAGLKLDTEFLSGSVGSSSFNAASASQVRPDTNFPTANYQQDGHVPPGPLSPRLLLSPAEPSPGSAVPSIISEIYDGRLSVPGSTFHKPDYSEDRQREDRTPATSPRMAPNQHREERPALSPRTTSTTLQVPTLKYPKSRHSPPSSIHEFPRYTDSPDLLSPVSTRPPSIRLPAASMSPESAYNLNVLPDDEEEDEMTTYSWWSYKYLPAPQTIIANLFPTLYGWRGKSLTDKLLGIATAPSVFLLTITLPVVETQSPEPPPPTATPMSPEDLTRSRSTTVQQYFDDPNAARKSIAVEPRRYSIDPTRPPDFAMASNFADEEDNGPKEWNRWLVFVQIFTAPLFVMIIVWANMEESKKMLLLYVLGSLAFSLVLLLLLLATSSVDRAPKYRPIFCYLGFLVAVAWISTIANEVVGVLKAFGVILNMSDAILGLTIFAVGNSLGDLVADITIAKLGYPVMALSACFGGPMLNILLGIGISGTYMTIKHASHHHKEHPGTPIHYTPFKIEVGTTLFISGITLLVTLCGLLIFVPLNGWRMDRKIGWGLIGLWTCSTIANVVVEILGIGQKGPA